MLSDIRSQRWLRAMTMPTDDELEFVDSGEELSLEEQQQVEQIRSGNDQVQVPTELLKEAPASPQSQNVAEMLRALKTPQKIKLPLFGNRTVRALLIRDSNRQIPLFVLQNAKLTEDEVVEFSRNSNLDDSVLRAIANSSQWMKSYSVKMNIVSNPRVPLDLSLRWLKFVQEKDLRLLARSKNVSSVVANQARKLLEKRAK